jgi:hypothetical protein
MKEKLRQPEGMPAGGEFRDRPRIDGTVVLNPDSSGRFLPMERTLPEHRLVAHYRPADWLLFRRDRLNLDAPYQRGSVWGLTRRQNLLKSMLMGLPVGSFLINDRGSGKLFVVDGKQRTEALMAFADGEFGIPAEWVDERFQGPLTAVEYDGKIVPGVTITSENHVFTSVLHNMQISTLESAVKTEADEAIIFQLINSGGVDQGKSDF